MINIQTIPYSGSERILAPANRIFWYIVTLGKYGDLYHYKHVPMKRFIAVVDNRVPYAYSLVNGNIVNLPFSFVSPSIVNCRCSLDEININ